MDKQTSKVFLILQEWLILKSTISLNEPAEIVIEDLVHWRLLMKNSSTIFYIN